MMPPTGLTFIVHALIVLVRKVAVFAGFRGQAGVTKKSPILSFFSVVIILGTFAYVSWTIALFVGRSVEDRNANWRLAGRAISSLKNPDRGKLMAAESSMSSSREENKPPIDSRAGNEKQTRNQEISRPGPTREIEDPIDISTIVTNLRDIYKIVPAILTRI